MAEKKLNGSYVKGREITTDMVGQVAELHSDPPMRWIIGEERGTLYGSVPNGPATPRLFRVDDGHLGKIEDPCSVTYQWKEFFVYHPDQAPVGVYEDA